MKVCKTWMVIAAVTLTMGVVSAQAATMTIDFQDRGNAAQGLSGSYAGFTWAGGWTTDNFDGGSNVFARGVSGASMDYEGLLGFTLDGFDFKVRVAANQAQDLTVAAYDVGGIQIGADQTVAVSTTWTDFTFDWGGAAIDKLVFTATAGLNNSRFFIDDFEYAPVPEPGTMVLLGSGLIGLAGYRRRRRA